MPNVCCPLPPLESARNQIRRNRREKGRVSMKTGKSAINSGMTALVVASLFFCPIVSAADFQISASLNRARVALNEQAVLSVTVSGEGSNLPSPKLPALPHFQVYNAGRSQNFSWINGKASASVTYSFV